MAETTGTIPDGHGTGRLFAETNATSDPDSTHRTYRPSADLEESRARRDRGMRDAEAGAWTGWRLAAERAIAELAASGRVWTAEDLRERVGDPVGSHPNAMGAVIGAAAREGVIEACGYRQAERPEAHGRVLRAWRGTRGAR